MSDTTDTVARDTTQDNPGVIAPPPLIYFGGLVIGLFLHARFPLRLFPRMANGARVPFGGALLALGITLALSGFQTMRRAGTNVNPTQPTTTIVVEGPYRLTRNPLYLSLTLCYAGIATLINTFWAMLLLPLVLLLINRGVIDREEQYLERKFGRHYLNYKERVGRWL